MFHPKKSAANLTEMEIYKAMREGQRAVWAKLPAIQVSGSASAYRSASACFVRFECALVYL